jgi:hypothetical protein
VPAAFAELPWAALRIDEGAAVLGRGASGEVRAAAVVDAAVAAAHGAERVAVKLFAGAGLADGEAIYSCPLSPPCLFCMDSRY